jgi:hypothetical protein
MWKIVGMQDVQAVLDIAAQAQINFLVITGVAVAVGVATADKRQMMGRRGYIIGCLLTCLLAIPAFIALKLLFFPEIDFSDPNPDSASMVAAARLMGFAFLPTALMIGRDTAYRNRDVGHADRTAYLAAVPVVGSLWMLSLLFKPSTDENV